MPKKPRTRKTRKLAHKILGVNPKTKKAVKKRAAKIASVDKALRKRGNG